MLLGQIVRKEGFCYGMHILEALDRQKQGDGRRIGEILIELGALDRKQLQQALLIQKGFFKNLPEDDDRKN